MKPFYNLSQEIIDDVDLYRLEVSRFLSGESAPDKFKPFRVSRGIYSQRGQKKYMVRIKVPVAGLRRNR